MHKASLMILFKIEEFMHQVFIKNVCILLLSNFSISMFSQETEIIYDELDRKIEKKLGSINDLEHDEFFTLVKPLLKDKRRKIIGFHYLGRYYTDKEIPDSTIYYGNKIYEASVRKTDSFSYSMLSVAYNVLAIGYGFKGLTGIRGEYHLKGLDLYEKGLVDENISVHHIRGLADYYLDIGEYEKAIPLYEKSIEVDINNNTVYFAYNNLGQIYIKLKQYDKALFYLEKANKAPDGHKALGYSFESISACYLNMEKYDEAIAHGQLAEKVFGDKDLKFILLSDITIAKSFHKKKMYVKSIMIYENLLKKVKSLGFIDIEIDVLENLSNSLRKQEKYRDADSYTLEKYKLKDSLVTIQKDRKNKELEIKFQILQKEKEIELLKKDQQLKQNQLTSEKDNKQLMFIAFLVILIPIMILLFVYRQKLLAKNSLAKKQEEINGEKINSLIKEQELKLIRASLEIQNTERKRIAQDLHDSIGGNLAAIKLRLDKDQIEGEEFNLIREQIDDTYHLIRKISHNLMPDKFYYNKFTDLIGAYLNNIGKINNLTISFNAFPKEKINKIDEQINVEIFRIIQELLTNALKHAKATKITVQMDLLPDKIYIIFEDNGIGFKSENVVEGIGLLNVKNRLKKINGKINVDSVLDRGTILNIEIDKNILISKIELTS